MNPRAIHIRNRLSLRPPQAESLSLLAEVVEALQLQKIHSPELLRQELEAVRAICPTLRDFERTFPSLCFSLATGVGKTRLMGAFIAYLYLAKGIRNFFVLAPNLTIYNKLIQDFGNPAYPKYVFNGIAELVANRPRIITGENYREYSANELFKPEGICINIFNISKINAESRAGATPKIRGMIEYLGQPYFAYLQSLPDLVLLMDESHHYRASAGMSVINELNPILGLELTATPKLTNGTLFKNVVYEYSLAKAIHDGFVKEPAVATRQNFDPVRYSKNPLELDQLKLEDGIRLHEDTKVALDIYARDNRVKAIKPFVLVVCRDTQHAREIWDMIQSNTFFGGYYADKVIEVHSNRSGAEKEEVIAQLLTVEDPANKIEIVIHVNMLKEGWDVTNLYTIVPLRTANAQILVEQTIGRGLRLPYGARVGETKVDRLTIVAHDRFDAIIQEANRPESLIRQENIITIDDRADYTPKEVVTVVSRWEEEQSRYRTELEQVADPVQRQQRTTELDARQLTVSVLPLMSDQVKTISDCASSQEAIEKVVAYAVQRIEQAPQQYLFKDELIAEVKRQLPTVIAEYKQQIIEIPRITVQPTLTVSWGFHDFELNTRLLNYQPTDAKIIVENLRTGEREIVDASGQRIRYDILENLLISELINFPEIDYDKFAPLIYKLAQQAVQKFESYLPEDGVLNVVTNNKREIARYIYTQMKQHFYVEHPDLEVSSLSVRAFTRIEEHNFSRNANEQVYLYSETITPTIAIPQKVFGGFKRACHSLYKFDSKTEKDLATILERETEAVLKWMRPARNQFAIWYDHRSKRYLPDFVVETPTGIYMVETKKESDIATTEVQDKARAAYTYCQHATRFTQQHGGKPWQYVIIPHNAVTQSMSFDFLATRYLYTPED